MNSILYKHKLNKWYLIVNSWGYVMYHKQLISLVNNRFTCIAIITMVNLN